MYFRAAVVLIFKCGECDVDMAKQICILMTDLPQEWIYMHNFRKTRCRHREI